MTSPIGVPGPVLVSSSFSSRLNISLPPYVGGRRISLTANYRTRRTRGWSGQAGMLASGRPMTDQLCAMWYGKGDLRVERRQVPPLGPRDVLLEVALCGVCGTDVHIVDGEYPLAVPPRVLGHEFS